MWPDRVHNFTKKRKIISLQKIGANIFVTRNDVGSFYKKVSGFSCESYTIQNRMMNILLRRRHISHHRSYVDSGLD